VAKRRPVEAAGTQPRGSPRVPAGGPSTALVAAPDKLGGVAVPLVMTARFNAGHPGGGNSAVDGLAGSELDEPAQKRRDRPRKTTECVVKTWP